MKSFINDVADNWSVDLTEDSTLFQFLPMLNLTLVNTGDSKVEIYMHGQRVGSCFGYSVFSLMGKPFETFRVTGTFNIGDIEVLASKMVTAAVMPYNPQIDLMEENLDKFASGTDKRISYSSSVSTLALKYWINAQNGLIVQRKLDVLGGASVGSYEIDFCGDTISGSTAINFPSVDLKRYKKTISNSEFDYTLTNCEIKGWLIDYLLDPNDMASGGTISIDLPGNGEKGVDDDMSTNQNEHSSSDTVWYSILEIEFPTSVTVTGGHIAALLAKSVSGVSEVKIQGYNGTAWEDITSVISHDTGSYVFKSLNTPGLSIPNIEKVRAYRRGSTSAISFCKLVDMTVIYE